MWGTGASSTQCEGAAPASDWIEWERAGHAPPSGDGNGFGDALRRGLRAVRRRSASATIGCRSSGRGSSPSRGVHDDAAVAHYRDMLDRRARRRRRAVGVPAPLHAAALVRRSTAASWSRTNRIGALGPARRLRRGDVRRPRRRMAAGQRDELLRPRGVPRRRVAARARRSATRPPSSTRRSTSRPPRRRCALEQTGAPVSSIFGAVGARARRTTRRDRARTVAAALRHVLGAGLGLFRDGVLQVRAASRSSAPTSRAPST